MKICIPIKFQAHGGGFYFLKAFESFLVTQGHSIIRDVQKPHNILFTNHWMVPRHEILRAFQSNPEVRIVQRIDGAAQDYGRLDDADQRQRAINKLADLTIFQSRYCRHSTREKFPVIIHDGPVIHNPVDIDCFRPDGSRREFPEAVRVACVAWSTVPKKGALSLYEVARRNPDVGFVMCGRYPNAPNHPNIHCLGVLDRHQLAEALRSCNFLLTFSESEACPNHVLEALASGLPVLYGDSGAMSEVIGDCGFPTTINDFPDRLAEAVQRGRPWSDGARRRALEVFHPDKIFPKYIDAILGAMNSPTVTSPFMRTVLALASETGLTVCGVVRKLRHVYTQRLRRRPGNL